MALKNVIYANTYTTVAVNYDHKKRYIQINATVFENDTCENIVTTLSTQYQALRDIIEVDAITTPNNPKEGDEFFSPIKIIIDNVDQFGLFSWNGAAWNCTHPDAVYCNDTYYKFTDDAYVIDTNPDNTHYWDNQFSLEKIKTKTDILAFAYTWLKQNHDAFKNAEDC